MNLAILHGNIGHLELKHVGQNNTAIVEFSVATVERRSQEKYTTWHNCKAFGKRAETIAQYFSKGSEILLEGRIELEKWEGKDGSKRSRTSIIVNSFDFCGRKGDNAGGGNSAPRTQAEAFADDDTTPPPAQQQSAPASEPTEITEEDLPF